MTEERGHFTSRIGFLMAAAGSAVGLGNIWGFPTQAASNGGAAFLLVYLVLAFTLAYPALMAELTIGRYARTNMVTALGELSEQRGLRLTGKVVGYGGVMVASLILSFYAIVAGWMLAEFGQPAVMLFGWENAASWLAGESQLRNLSLCLVFSIFTALIIARGVEKGIETWATRLMPLLAIILVALIGYVLAQPGAQEGLRAYLIPDFSRVTDPNLILSALGQAFFSLSLGVGAMLIYGSYLKKTDSLPRLGAEVTLLDTGIAFTAGLLIIPAIYVAQYQGIAVFNPEGELLAGPGLVFQVLPALFVSMGDAGVWVALAFFALMSIAALTSSISMLEVPVSVLVERGQLGRPLAAAVAAGVIFGISSLIIAHQALLFDFTVALTTRYSQPLLGIALCLFAGWVMHRDTLLKEMREGHPDIEQSFFWKIWPLYVRVVCPTLILLVLIQTLRT